MTAIPKVRLASRLMTIDLPYYAEWLEHHDRLGVESFHLFYSDDTHLPLREHLGYFPTEKITLARVPKTASELDFTGLLPKGAGEYTLHIDSDEMLVLPHGKQLGAFILESGGHDFYRFPWVMSPSVSESHDSMSAQSLEIPSYRVGQHKSMARSELITGCGDMHDFLLSAAPRSIFRHESAYVQHFAARGLVDVYLRCRDQALRKNHPGDPAKLVQFLDPATREIRVGDLPKRLIATLGEIRCGNPRDVVGLPEGLVSKTNNELLQQLCPPREFEMFRKRWEDLLAADLFAGFTIKDYPKLEIWNHLAGRENERIPLGRL